MPPPKAPAKKVVRPAEAAAARQMAELATSPDEPLIRNTMVGRDPVRGAMSRKCPASGHNACFDLVLDTLGGVWGMCVLGGSPPVSCAARH
jgi:hypothetical protein